MKLIKHFILLTILILVFDGCSCVLQGTRFHIKDNKFTSEQQLTEFLQSFSKLLEENEYIVKIVTKESSGNNTVKDGHGVYPILLEAEQESFSMTSTVRVCKEESNGIFVQFVLSACLKRDSEKYYIEECNRIYNILTSKYPEYGFDGGCH